MRRVGLQGRSRRERKAVCIDFIDCCSLEILCTFKNESEIYRQDSPHLALEHLKCLMWGLGDRSDLEKFMHPQLHSAQYQLFAKAPRSILKIKQSGGNVSLFLYCLLIAFMLGS